MGYAILPVMATRRSKAPYKRTLIHEAAVALGSIGGKKGGSKGGKIRMAMLSAKERSTLARKAVLARWAKKRAG